ncbi:MAG: OmpA family protein [bacterium]
MIKKSTILFYVFLTLALIIFSGCRIRKIAPVNLINDIPPVRRMDSESASMLDNLHKHSPEKQKEVLKDVLRRVMRDFFKDEGIELGTMKDRVFRYLGMPQSETNRIYFYLVSGDNIEAEGGDGRIHRGYIENGCVMSVVTETDSSVYILKCTNGLSRKTKQEFTHKQLIGELQNQIQMEVVYFALNKSNVESLKETEREKLRTCANLISVDTSVKADIIGHTDSEGADDYNAKLSTQRAYNVREHLIELGVSERQIGDLLGRGEKELLQTDYVGGDKKEQAARKNRRVEIKMYSWDIVSKPTLSNKL